MPQLELNLAIHHRGVPATHAPYYESLAAVCLGRHHEPPMDVLVGLDSVGQPFTATWVIPSADEKRGAANHDEATRDGAYCLALAAAHAHMQRVALRRSEGRTGADWYLVPVDTAMDDDDDLDLDRDDLIRLEVSGIDNDDEAKIHGRLREKVRQAKEGNSDFPAYAAVVGFRRAVVRFAKVP